MKPERIWVRLALAAAIGCALFGAAYDWLAASQPNIRPPAKKRLAPESLRTAEKHEGHSHPFIRPDANEDAAVKQWTGGLESVELLCNEGGYEMPFSESAHSRDVPVLQDPRSVSDLFADFRAAVLNGRNPDIRRIRPRIVSLGKTAIPFLSEWLNCGSEMLEIEAVRLLAQIGEAQGLAQALAKVLAVPRESSSYDRFLGAFAVTRCPAVVEWVAGILEESPGHETNEQLLDLLQKMRGPAVVMALAYLAQTSPDDRLLQSSVTGLAMRRDASETEALAGLLDSGHTGIREAAACGLAGIGSRKACRILVDRLGNDSAGVQALALISSPYAQESLLALATETWRTEAVRISAVRALSSHAGDRVWTVLANAAGRESSTAVEKEMLITLAAINNRQKSAKDSGESADNIRGESCF